MPAVIALVGRPNVGKSTLFNKLTKSRDALVADLPGLTRDRQYGDGRLGDFPYIVVDTGGLGDSLDTSGEAADGKISLDSEMLSQTAMAIDESDVVVFMVDGRAGCTASDELLAQQLRRRKTAVVLVVNKVDGIGDEQAKAEFFALGLGEPSPISAAHNRGLLGLLDQVVEKLPESLQAAANEAREKAAVKTAKKPKAKANDWVDFEDMPPGTDISVAVEVGTIAESDVGVLAGGHASGIRHDLPEVAFIGRPNVGKSTLVNRLCGEERVIAFDQPGTTRDTIRVPFSRSGKDYWLVDTAGVRKRGRVNETVEKFSIIKTLQAIDQANICVYLMDAHDSITDQDLHLIGYIIDKGRGLVVAINKWDSISADQRDKVREDLERRVEFLKFTKLHFISALKGSGVNDLFKSINKAYVSAFSDLSTPQLTRLLEVAVEQHQPPMVNGRRIKLRFAHQGGVNPPVIVVHGNQTAKLPQDYQRYLTNFFQKQLHLFGTPLRIQYKQGDNPYATNNEKGKREKSKRKVIGSGKAAAAARVQARKAKRQSAEQDPFARGSRPSGNNGPKAKTSGQRHGSTKPPR